MGTEFQRRCAAGKILAHGERDNGIYRLFREYEAFENLSELLAESGGVAIQPSLFETPTRPPQLNIGETQ